MLRKGLCRRNDFTHCYLRKEDRVSLNSAGSCSAKQGLVNIMNIIWMATILISTVADVIDQDNGHCAL